MTLGELISLYRLRTDDVAEPFLWSDEEITAYINEAVREASFRARLIFDDTTASICTLAVTTGNPVVITSPLIIEIERATLDGVASPLTRTSPDRLDSIVRDWKTLTGTPHAFIMREGSVRLFMSPTANSTLHLDVYRLPLDSEVMEDEDDEPPINAQYHERMLDWALHRGYSKRDSDAYDEQKAAEFDTSFTASFGVRPDANVQRKIREKRPPIVAFNPGW